MESTDTDNVQETNGNNLFASMSRRRLSCPQILQYLWDAVKISKYQRQFPTKERLFKYIQKNYSIPTDELDKQLHHSARDKLLEVIIKPVGDKKAAIPDSEDSSVRMENGVLVTEGYSFPRDFESVIPESHDWYCFECHLGGDVLSCSVCHRVFHCSCIKADDSSEQAKKFVCKICTDIEKENECNVLSNISKRRLNRLLEYLTIKLKEKFPDNVRDRTFEEPAIVPPAFVPHRRASNVIRKEPTDLTFRHLLTQDCEWRMRKIMHTYIDLNSIYENTKVKKYKNIEEYRADVLTMIHNVVVYHGSLSSIAVKAREMLRECSQCIDDIKCCHFCFKHGNEKVKRYWFCKPCTPPHDLVYAKQDEPPFWWPAKVFKKEDTSYDVWFFGDHNRAKVDIVDTKPIAEDVLSLVTKRTTSFNKALKELQEHQFLLEELSSVTNNFSIAYTDSSSSEEDDEVLEDEKKSLLRLKLAPMLKNIAKNRSKSASASTSNNNSPGCFSENSSTSFSSKIYVQSPDASKKSPELKFLDVKSPDGDKMKQIDDIDADSESEEVNKKAMKKSTKKTKSLKKKKINNKLDSDESDISKIVENHTEPSIERFNSTELKSQTVQTAESSKTDSNIEEKNLDETSNQRVTRKRNSLRNIVSNKQVVNNVATEKVPDKVHPKLSSSKLEKIVKNLESKAEKKDDKQLSDCDKDEEKAEIPLDLRLQQLNNKRASRDSEDKKVLKPETVPPLTIILNNDKVKKPKKSTENNIEKDVGDSTDDGMDSSCNLDSESQRSAKTVNSKSKSKSKKETKLDEISQVEENKDEEEDIETSKNTILTRKPLRRKHYKEDESFSPYLDDGIEETNTVVKRKRLVSRRKSKKDSTEEHDKEAAIKKSCMVRKALYKLKEKFQLDDEDEEDSNTTERENESDTNQEDENMSKTDDDSSEKKTRALRKTVLRTKIPLEEINDDTLLHKISDEQDLEEKRKKTKLFARSLRTKSQKDDTEENDANKNNEEEQSKELTNFSVLKKFRTSPRKVKSIPSNDSSTSDIPNICLETNDTSPLSTPAKVSLKRGRPKKVNSSSNSVCSDDLMSDSGANNKIDIVNNNDTNTVTSFNMEVAEEKSGSGDEAPEGLTKHKHFVKNIPKKRKTIKNMPILADSDKDVSSPTHDDGLGEGLNGIIKHNEDDSNSSSSHDVVIEMKDGKSRTISTQTRLRGKGGNPFGCSKEWLEVIKQEFHHEKLREIEKLNEKHKREMQYTVEMYEQLMKDNKRKQWCFHCGLEAIYHCCWNTAYCSIPCQQIHWTLEHRHFCRRRPR
ncbi:hypothetical protein M8J76_012331 [Diaphorina citri]|nr:hypothetical protein M8J75_005836 [Diaphorina citri]KAI5726993.1 hypothetical protein M8J76_012331 [Diaphorina citri]